MISRRHRQPRSQELAQYLEGDLSASDASRLEDVLAGSPEARVHLNQLRRIREGLAELDPELANTDLVATLSRSIAADDTRQPEKSRWFVWSACAATAAALLLATVVGLRGGLTARESEFRAKSAAQASQERTLAGVRVYRYRDHESPEAVAQKLSSSDGLLFSFLNTGDAPFEYLMVFGVDAANEIRWFFPAYVEERAHPMSIRIAEQRAHTLLPDVIKHYFASGQLAIYALFLHRALDVQAVERWLQAERFRPVTLPMSDAKLQKFELTVVP